MPKRMYCPKIFSKRNCHRKYLRIKSNLHALMVHLRARGHRATIVKQHRFAMLGVHDETGSLHLPSVGFEREHRRGQKREKPVFPLFVMWQEKRLVLLKGKPRGRKGLAHLR
jgi:hypothetical protein